MACLPITDSASVGVPYYSQGGGGGGGSNVPADLAVSTLTVNPNGFIDMPGQVGFSAGLRFQSTSLGNVTLQNALQFNGDNSVVSFVLDNGLCAPLQVSEIDFTNSSSGGAAVTYIKCLPNQGILQFGTGGGYVDMTPAPLQVSSLTVSSINGAQPGGAVPEDLTLNSLSSSAIAASSITLQGAWKVPLFQGGRFTMPNADSNVVETDVIFSGTDWFAWATYNGAVTSAVSSIGTQVLSPSTFALWAQGGLGVSWMAQGN